MRRRRAALSAVVFQEISMRSVCAIFLLIASSPSVLGDSAGLKEARQRWLHGNYEEARELYQAATKEPKQYDQAIIGLSRTWESQGEYDKALEAIDGAIKENAKSADLLGRRAELLYLRGRWDDADKAAGSALEIHKDHLPARWIRAQPYRDRGDLKN